MKSHRYSIEALASKVGMDRSSLSLRLNNRREFTQEDMLRISEVLDIQRDDLADYFLKIMLRKLRKNDLVKIFHIEKIIQELKILKLNKLNRRNKF